MHHLISLTQTKIRTHIVLNYNPLKNKPFFKKKIWQYLQFHRKMKKKKSVYLPLMAFFFCLSKTTLYLFLIVKEKKNANLYQDEEYLRKKKKESRPVCLIQ